MARQHVRKVAAIKNGTVIDHLPVGSALKILRILTLEDNGSHISVGLNFPSKKLGSKDIIKIENRELTRADLNRIALLAPFAMVSIIRNYTVAKKLPVYLSRTLTGLLKCPNPRCITNAEPMETAFAVIKRKPLSIRCNYCQRLLHNQDIVFN